MLTYLCDNEQDKDLLPYDESRREKVQNYVTSFKDTIEYAEAATTLSQNNQRYFKLYGMLNSISY